ncbi:transcription factor IIIB 90 kDa subunit [Anabrus simplex]|uniref:transcription factor IIIB 90 kDa subunit n=1 Tax=Anabrus simplex TaxID=316456 RepID=UPI0035A30B41
MANNKCKHCGCDTIEEDPAHGYTVCTSCGAVLEDSSIVSQIQFEENAQGGSSSIGQFVSSESKGGASGFGGSFRSSVLGRESREITIQRAKKEITRLAHLLRLGQTSIDAALNLYKVALQNNLTKGRHHSHVISACLYMQCRLEGSPHLLIDFSEALQTCVFTLGRIFLRLSHALCITLPSMDPCIYVLRYASQLDFGKQTHAVSMTALRLVSRMKRDNIHTGRRPSGLCGAALLIAARLHDFSRDVEDIIKVVKVHDSTLRKRLMEFGNTPSSALSLDDFMNVDLEEEQDPPSFKKDEERLDKLDEYSTTFSEFQREIDRQLEHRIRKGKRKRNDVLARVEDVVSGEEAKQVGECIRESTLDAISECLPTSEELESSKNQSETSGSAGLGPTLATLGLLPSEDSGERTESASREPELNPDITLDDLDEDEIDSYIMTDSEVKCKDKIWMEINANYLQEQKEKKERLAKEKEEGKQEKKKRRAPKKSKESGIASTPGEAIERMLVEKNISSKINYDVLKTLNMEAANAQGKEKPQKDEAEAKAVTPSKARAPSSLSLDKVNNSTPSLLSFKSSRITPNLSSSKKTQQITSVKLSEPTPISEEQVTVPDKPDVDNLPDDDDYFEDDNPSERDVQGDSEMSLAEMLNHHREDDEYYGDEYDDY